MASASVLQKLTQRAREAEEMVGQLKQQIEQVKQTAGVSVSKPEEMRLNEENQRLREEIEKLKVRLVLAEIRNGVKQVPLPTKKSKVETNQQTETQGQGQATMETKQPKQKKESDKGKKVDQKSADQAEPKAKKGKTEKKQAEAVSENIDVSRLDMRVGKIVSVKKHPDADSQYVEKVDVGHGQILTVVSGLVNYVPIEEMQDRLAVFMCNLKPAKIRGVLSEGMILCACTPEAVEILIPPPGSQIGDRVNAKDYPGEPDALLKPKKKIWETVKPDLVTNAERVAVYKGSPLEIKGKGQIVVPTLTNAQIS